MYLPATYSRKSSSTHSKILFTLRRFFTFTVLCSDVLPLRLFGLRHFVLRRFFPVSFQALDFVCRFEVVVRNFTDVLGAGWRKN